MLIAQVMQVVGDSIRCDFSIRRGNRQQLASDMFFSRAAFGGMDVSRARAYHRVMRSSQALESDDVCARTGEDKKHLLGAERVAKLLNDRGSVRILPVGRGMSSIDCRDRRDHLRVDARPVVRCEGSTRIASGHRELYAGTALPARNAVCLSARRRLTRVAPLRAPYFDL